MQRYCTTCANQEVKENEKISSITTNSMSGGGFTDSASDRDQYFADAGNFIIDKEKALVPESIKRFVISLSLTNSLFI